MQTSHPILRFYKALAVGIAAVGCLFASGQINPHSVTWLFGVFTSAGLFIAACRTRSFKLHRAYAVYLASLTTYLLAVWMLHIMIPGPDPERIKHEIGLYLQVIGVGGILMPITLYHFTIRFAQLNHWVFRLIEYVGWVIAIIFSILNVLGIFFHDFIWAEHVWVPKVDGVYMYFFLFTTFFVTLGVGLPFVRLFTNLAHLRKLQLFYYLLGALPLWISCWGHFSIGLGINIYPAGGIIFVLHAAIMTYAVFKRRLFDVTVIIRRSLAYAVLSVILGMFYVGTLLLLSLWRNPDTTQHLIQTFIFIAITGFAYAPLLTYAQSKIDRIFFRTASDRQAALERFSRTVASTVDLESVAHSLCSLTHESFLPRRIRLYLTHDQTPPVFYASFEEAFSLGNWPNDELLDSQTLDAVQGGPSARFNIDMMRSGGPIELIEGNEGIVTAIIHNQALLGYLVLDPKRADESYSDDEIRFAETIAAQSAVALSNAKSFKALEQLQALTTQTLDGLEAGVFVMKDSGEIVKHNRVAERILKTSEIAPFPRTLNDVSALLPPLASAIKLAVQDGVPRINEELSFESSPRMYLLLSVQTLSDIEEGKLILVHLHDISEYKKLELHTRRQEGLAKVGSMIAGINHELKNILQPISHQVTQLSGLTFDHPTFSRAMEILPDRITVMQRLLLNLKNLASPIELRKRPLELEDLIHLVWSDAKDLPGGDRVKLEFKTRMTEPCMADGYWIRLVLFNLLRNAVEALESTPEPLINVELDTISEYSQICVRDNGSGIDPVQKNRLFEPFFSTKSGAGTGLGLSICRKILELHGGTIEAESNAASGTAFTIRLPLK